MSKKVKTEEQEDAEETGRASFLIHDGKQMLRVQALKDCWAIQRPTVSTNSLTGVTTEGWASFKYVADIGSVANRFFNFRLKNAEVSTLEELSKAAKQIAIDVRKEFSLKGDIE